VSVDAARLTAPLDGDQYALLREGVEDDPAINVYINAQGDFAFLDPMPVTDYASYETRSEKLGLKGYKHKEAALRARLEKIGSLLPRDGKVLEIGAADGAFLALAREIAPTSHFASIEPDQRTRPERDALPWLTQYDDMDHATVQGGGFDLVMLFHVFEHVLEPAGFLNAVKGLLADGGALLIEVPCLHDPLLSLYENPDYQAFYFQRQHPFVYSAGSLERVLDASGYAVRRRIPLQRYGLENHLQWLTKGKPGGNALFREVFAGSDDAYRAALEAAGTTDTIIVEAVAA
jgi:SAM-dependent methyltransferase